MKIVEFQKNININALCIRIGNDNRKSGLLVKLQRCENVLWILAKILNAERCTVAWFCALALVFHAHSGFLDRCLLELVRTQGYHIFDLLYINTPS